MRKKGCPLPVVFFALALVLTFMGPVVGGVPTELSLSDAVKHALENNPQILVTRQQVLVHRGLLRTARSIPSMELLAVPFGTFNDNPIIVSQSFDVFGKRDARSQSARRQIEGAVYDLQSTEASVKHDVTVAYIALQEASESQKSAINALELMQSLRKLAQQRFELGDVPRVHVTRTEIEVERARQDLVRLSAQLHEKRAVLNALMGRDPATPVEPSDPLTLGSNETADIDRLKEVALNDRPELKSARSILAARRSDIRFAQAQRLPELSFQVRAGERSGSAGNQLGFGVSLPLFDWGAIGGQVKAAKARAGMQRATITRDELEVVLEVESAHRRVAVARSISEAYASRIVPDSNSLARTLQLSYEQGGSTLLEVIDAQRTLNATRIEQLRALSEYRTALAALARAVGGGGW